LSYARSFSFVQPAHLTCFSLCAKMLKPAVIKAQSAGISRRPLSAYL